MSDRYLPDKAIDVMDEAGSRAHILNIKVPQNIIDLELEIEKIRTEKNSVVMKQRFEDAASLRDKEQKLINKLNDLQKKWKSSEELNPSIISEENNCRCCVHNDKNSSYKSRQSLRVKKLLKNRAM